jgi:hypothetical protein
MSDVKAFAAEYSEADSQRINFAWNGRHAKDLADRNYDFRKKVLDEVLKDPDGTPIPLIRDLFEAETSFAKEAWCVDLRVRQLAEILLTRGGPTFVEDFFCGKYRGQDAYIAAGTYPKLASSLLVEIDKRLGCSLPDARRRLLEIARRDCEEWLKA